MDFEWDPRKAATNLLKHGIDFEDAVHVFDGPVLLSRSDRNGEIRCRAVGALRGVEVAVAFTFRGPALRIISARRARRHERAEYRAACAKRAAGGADRLGAAP